MATAADILGNNRKSKVPARWADQYHQLCAERDRLLDRDYSTPEPESVKLDDMGDAASEESERGLSLLAATATNETIAEVLAAIRRLENGTYGICEVTGEPIEPERLEAIPWARYSLTGQRELERNGLDRKRALPSLQSVMEPVPADSDEPATEEEAA